ncbi:MAG: alginate export family protein [Myxococcota bacterium]
MIPRTMMMNEIRRVFALAIVGFGLGSMIVIVDSMFWPNLALAATSDPYGPEPTGIDAPKRRRVLTERAGERRPEDQFQFDVFGRPLTIGGEIEIRGRYRDNPRIDPTRDSDAFSLRPGAELEFFYALTPNVSAFAELKYLYDAEHYQQDGPKDQETTLRRGETWLHFADILESGLSIQIGRQNFKEKREWWWDEDLDGIRFFYEFDDFETQFAITHDFGPTDLLSNRIEPEIEKVLFLLGQGTWHWRDRNQIDVFFVHRNDRSRTEQPGDIVKIDQEDKRDAVLTWLGIRARGRYKHRPLGVFKYWADLAFVAGKETVLSFDDIPERPGYSEVDGRTRFDDILGVGLDLGVTWDPRDIPFPRVTLGYAYGSGDDSPTRGSDGTFRQTGLQDNNARWGGVDRFRYYGELFRPELSNLHVLTVAIGVDLFESSSIELVYHYYRQDEAAETLRESRLKASAGGSNPDLGHEIDLIVGLEEWEHIEIELIGSVFRAGSAFDSDKGEIAGLGIFKVNYNF